MQRPRPSSFQAKAKAQRGAYLIRGILWATALCVLLWSVFDFSRPSSTGGLSAASSRLFGAPRRGRGGGAGAAESSRSTGASAVSAAAAAAAPAGAPSPAAPLKRDVAIVVLCRESEADDLVKTFKNFDTAYNAAKLHDYVVFTDEPFSLAAEAKIAAATRSRVIFHVLDAYAWGVPNWIDRRNFSHVLSTATYYGNTEAYRKMCRFFAGPVFTTPVLANYRYAWRLDSHVRYLCDVVDDPIARMDRSGALYGFALRMKEKMDTIPSLWATAEDYAVRAGRKAAVKEHWDVTIPGHGVEVGCHYWNNMEITRLSWFGGSTYQDYFKALDASGGFFYERWGDAPVRSFALLLLARKQDVVYFEEMGYQHPWWVKCPPPSGVCFHGGVAMGPGQGEGGGCNPDPEIQPITWTDGAMCQIGQ
jgi:alpha 1,2-mannosyltransferase